jgi:uncharacterized membrane protein YphA (DoxX/SURF4 family)
MLLRRIARPMLSAAFIGQGVEALIDVKPAAEVVRPTLDGLQALPESVAAKVPRDAVTVARINAAAQIAGGLLLATGRIPRAASALLAATVIPGNLGKHMFWSEDDPARKAEKRRAFLTDVSLIGGLVLASADTAGKPSLGWRGRRAGSRVAQAVSSALPSSNDSLLESDFAERVSHGVQTGVERGRELAGTAIEKGVPLASAAFEKSAAVIEKTAAKTAEKAAPLAAEARRRSTELAETALEQGGDQLASGWRRVRAQR